MWKNNFVANRRFGNGYERVAGIRYFNLLIAFSLVAGFLVASKIVTFAARFNSFKIWLWLRRAACSAVMFCLWCFDIFRDLKQKVCWMAIPDR